MPKKVWNVCSPSSGKLLKGKPKKEGLGIPVSPSGPFVSWYQCKSKITFESVYYNIDKRFRKTNEIIVINFLFINFKTLISWFLVLIHLKT